jgi:integrase/recombinase XerC
MQMMGRSDVTVYERKRAIIRMGQWLANPSLVKDLPPVSVLDATEDDLKAWRASLRLCAVATRTYVAHGRSFYDWAIAEGIRPDNPAARLPVPGHHRYLPRPVGEKALFLALETAPPRVRPFLLLAAYAGLRSAEVAGLTAECLLLGRHEPLLIVSAGAKGRHERVVPVSAYLAGELRAASLPRSGWVFLRADGAGPNRPWRVSQLANDHLRSLGLADTFHSLRHFFATSCYQGGRDLLAVSHLLGHANVSTTSVYARFSDPAAAAAVECVPVPPRLRAVREDGTA